MLKIVITIKILGLGQKQIGPQKFIVNARKKRAVFPLLLPVKAELKTMWFWVELYALRRHLRIYDGVSVLFRLRMVVNFFQNLLK